MNEEQQLKLQAFLDSELPEKEAREIAAWLAGDQEATALLNELRNTRKAFKDSAPAVRVPETRDFYWSKIRRGIERMETPPRTAPTVSPLLWLRRLLLPAGAVAVLAFVILGGLERGGSNQIPGLATEMAVADPGAFTYHDYVNGTTLVWLSYPAER